MWQPSPDRFEGGLISMLKTIRDHGMAPGLWLELEVMGVDCPLVKEWPAECFFRRHGLPIVNRGRYQLDFRHPVVIAHSVSQSASNSRSAVQAPNLRTCAGRLMG